MKLGPEWALRQYMICPSFKYAGLLSEKIDDSHTYIFFPKGFVVYELYFRACPRHRNYKDASLTYSLLIVITVVLTIML